MIIVRIVGGLGNQMFQYAYAKALQQKGYDVKIDLTKFKNYKLHGGYQLNQLKIDLETTTPIANILCKIGFRKSVKEKSLLFDQKFLEVPQREYIKGYFQTEKYFASIRTVLLKQFVLKKELSNTTLHYLKEITIQKNACSLHIRRGDYITDEKANSVHGICDLKYYKGAIKLIQDKFRDSHFFIFSDDISWAQKNLIVKNTTYIAHNVIPHEDMHLMSLCKHNITANSSFSWWGAWLNQHEDKTVIAPKKWFVRKENEVACANWIQL
ncbi:MULTISPECIES: alpha-1,2-fucosyltransferase [unclassified Polaribacter]|uniref:alpha-1,2-fucosyltransferase n=1 Tax=unclassified Polaribacter TaxID=196858 RepID=UPI0011BEE75E|nr:MULTISPECIES: alpha-1,2-fucosyltransferase [unclassified Polaribacter]TXD52979.1 alpha-1,2-fucosyltransferase [Polaribacter sp. IC063]TXD60929.1 alpha-1,2-fucosyltransferase [Polaribacter sp. IC066]